MRFWWNRNRKKKSQETQRSDQFITENELMKLVDTSADLLDAGQPKEAKKLCLELIKIFPDCAEAWSNLAFAELQLGDNKAAATAAERSLSLEPLSAIAWHNLGEAYQNMEMPEKALHYNNRSLTIDAQNAVSWGGRGAALMKLERYEEAEACFEKALTINPDFEIAKLNKEVSHLFADTKSRDLLLITLGIAIHYSEGKLGQNVILSEVQRFVASYRDQLDHSLIRSFDCFAQMNIKNQLPFVVYFCHINYLLAHIIGDSDLLKLCSSRLEKAKAVFNI